MSSCFKTLGLAHRRVSFRLLSGEWRLPPVDTPKMGNKTEIVDFF